MDIKPKYTIGELADISGINAKTLRLYDEKGLLKSSARDEDNNYRYYSEQKVVDAVMIREMKRRGFSMTELKSLLQTHDLNHVKQQLDDKIKTLQRKMDTLQEQIDYTRNTHRLVEEALAVYSEETHSQHVRFETTSDMMILYVRKRGYVNANQLFWNRYNELQKLREELKVTPAGPFSAIFYDHYFNQFFFDEGDLEVYLPIREQDMVSPYVRKVKGFTRASLVFVGWYANLLATYVELVKQIEKHGYCIAGPAYEEYLVEFSYGVSEENCVTRVSFPVEPIV